MPRVVGAAGVTWVAAGMDGMIDVSAIFSGSGWLQCPFFLVPSLHGFLFFDVECPSCRLLSIQELHSSYCLAQGDLPGSMPLIPVKIPFLRRSHSQVPGIGM